MNDKEEIKALKAKGEVIISKQTYNKQVELVDGGYATGYLYKGKVYKYAHWLLTYSHEQFYWLTDRLNNLNVHKSSIGD